MQVPTRNQMNAEESLEDFFEDFPALGMLGTPYQILPDTPYVIDEDVQLVSKYLRAYRIGGTKGIDRLYKEGTCRLLLFYNLCVPQYEVVLAQSSNLQMIAKLL